MWLKPFDLEEIQLVPKNLVRPDEKTNKTE